MARKLRDTIARELLDGGMTIDEIAHHMHVRRSTVERYVRECSTRRYGVARHSSTNSDVWRVEFDPNDLFCGAQFTAADIKYTLLEGAFPDGMQLRNETKGLHVVRNGELIKI